MTKITNAGEAKQLSQASQGNVPFFLEQIEKAAKMGETNIKINENISEKGAELLRSKGFKVEYDKWSMEHAGAATISISWA